MRAVDRVFPSVEFSNWPLCDRLLPHGRLCAEYIHRRGMLMPEASHLLKRIGYYLHQRAQYAEAEPLYRRALAIREEAKGSGHPDTASTLNNLAGRSAQGKMSEAEPLYRRALAIRDAALGPNHPETVATLNNLAGLLYSKGKKWEAEPLYRLREKSASRCWGHTTPRQPSPSTTSRSALRAQRKLSDAEALYRRALGDLRTLLGR